MSPTKVEPLIWCGKEPPRKTDLFKQNKYMKNKEQRTEGIMCFGIGDFGTGDKPILVFSDGDENVYTHPGCMHLIHLLCLF